MARCNPPNYWRGKSERTQDVVRRRMLPPFRTEGPLQLDPIWREARELGVENEYGSMFAPTWDAQPMPEPRQGTWAATSDHYFRYHSSRELQFPWRSHGDDLEMSPEPSERDIESCLMNTPDCTCRSLLLDSLQNPHASGSLSYDPTETDLSRLPSTDRPPGYVCAGRVPHKHIRIRSASLQGFVTPMLPQPGEGSSRTFFEPEQQALNPNPFPPDDAVPVSDDDAEFDDILVALEILSGQAFENPNKNWVREVGTNTVNAAPEPMNVEQLQEREQNAEPDPEPLDTIQNQDQVDNVEQVVEVDPGHQLRRPRPGQNMLQYMGDSEDENDWESPEELPEEDSQRSTGQDKDGHMLDAAQLELLDYDEEVGAPSNWAPRSGDVMILKSCRYNIPWPGFDGKVEIYVDENEHYRYGTDPWTCWFEDGDIIVRFGSYSQKWQWTQAPQVRVYQYREGKFYLVGRQTIQPLYPMEYKFVDPQEKITHHMDFRLKPRRGDLIINRGIRFPFVWYIYWWDEGMPVRPSDLLVRAAYDEDANFSYCDAEVYLRNPDPAFPDNWIFLGKDDYCFNIVN
ncbi:hypothetical protein R1flu_013466 [Riccia fluitans]|uniref:Uncharacterized protein n=1 Tax=Riccia fluitans TaxID=41844 RepID=A0ABD1YE28_9MARC